MCLSAPMICNEPGGHEPVLSLSLDRIGPLWITFSDILIGIQTFSVTKMHLKMSSAKWHPFCVSLNMLSTTTPKRVHISWDAPGIHVPHMLEGLWLYQGVQWIMFFSMTLWGIVKGCPDEQYLTGSEKEKIITTPYLMVLYILSSQTQRSIIIKKRHDHHFMLILHVFASNAADSISYNMQYDSISVSATGYRNIKIVGDYDPSAQKISCETEVK